MRTIRTGTLADKDGIAAVEAECFPSAEAATAEQFSDRLKHYADHFLLMFDDDRLIEQGRMGVVLTCKGRLIRYYEKFGFVNEGLTAKSTHGGAEWYQMRLTFED